MLIFAGIFPHSPLSLPLIGKDHHKKLSATLSSYDYVRVLIEKMEPDIFIVLSPHTETNMIYTIPISHPDHPSVYHADFHEFGEFSTSLKYKNDPDLLADILSLHPSPPIKACGVETLDYGISIPLYHLTKQNPTVRILPIGIPNDLSPSVHIVFGSRLINTIMMSEKRIAVLISADLAHTLTQDAPAGYHDSGKVFDDTIRNYLSQNKLIELKDMNKETIVQAVSCGFNPLLVLSGMIHDKHHIYHELSYEYPFGIGYLTSYFEFPIYV